MCLGFTAATPTVPQSQSHMRLIVSVRHSIMGPDCRLPTAREMHQQDQLTSNLLFDVTHVFFLFVQHIAAEAPHLLMHSQECTSDAIGRNSCHPHCCNRERVLGATVLRQPNSCAACCCRHHDLHSQQSST